MEARTRPLARSAEASRKKALLIFPYNGNALEALDCLGHRFRFRGFVEDDPRKQGIDGYGYWVFDRGALAINSDAQVLAVPGSPASYQSRRTVIEGLGLAHSRFATVIHPGARVSPMARIGRNVLLMAGVVVTSNAVIGDHVCVLPNTVIHHHARVGSWSLVGSNVTIAGDATIGENCYIASGTTISNGLCVGDLAMVGLGSNVIDDVAAGAVVAGNPARALHHA
jgi:sugar O-acyltransferase (sialic acid O-acetyltransferase NeuD family)